MGGLFAILIIILFGYLYWWVEKQIAIQDRKRNFERTLRNQCNSVSYSKLYRLERRDTQ